jgi:hypothetical protein
VFCKLGCFDPSSSTDQKPYFMLIHDMIAMDDGLVRTDRSLNEMLNRVIENPNNPALVDLSRFPWEQEARHYSAYIFVVNGQDEKSFARVPFLP